jgi:hypothetical protein
MKESRQNESIVPPLIPRELLFGNPERWQPTLSPDGKRMAYLAPDTHEVRQVWVRTRGAHDDRCVTADRRRGISFYGWAWDSSTVIYIQDSDGDENYHLFAVDLETTNVRDLTAWQGVRCEFVASHPKYRDELLVALNVRDRRNMDVWRLNLITGAATLDTENPGDVLGWIADDDFVVRGATAITAQGAWEIRVRDSVTASWRAVVSPGAGDEVWALGFSKDGSELFLKSSIDSETIRVVAKNLTTVTEREIARDAELDAEGVLLHPIRRTIEAVAFEPGRRQWKVVDPAVASDFDALAKTFDGDFSILSRDEEDKIWIVVFEGDRLPHKCFLWDAMRDGQAYSSAVGRSSTTIRSPPRKQCAFVRATEWRYMRISRLRPSLVSVGFRWCYSFMEGLGRATIGASIHGCSFSPIAVTLFCSLTIVAPPATARNTCMLATCSGVARCRTI